MSQSSPEFKLNQILVFLEYSFINLIRSAVTPDVPKATLLFWIRNQRVIDPAYRWTNSDTNTKLKLQVSNSLLAVVSEVSDRNGTMYRSERRWYGHVTSCDILDKSRYEAERTSAGPLLKDHLSNWFSWSIYFWHSNLLNKNPIFGIGKIDHQLSDKWYIKTDVHDKNNHKISDFCDAKIAR